MDTVIANQQNHSRRFPPEIEIMFLLARKKDREFLAKCSLVCSEWHFIARQYLFSSILVRSSQIQDLVDLAERYPENSLVDRLVILRISSESYRPMRERQGPWYISPDNGLCAKTFQSVTSLSIVNVMFRHIWDLIDVVCQFSALEKLFIRYWLPSSSRDPFRSTDQSPAIAPIPVERFPKGLKAVSLDVGRNLSLFYTLLIGLTPQVDAYEIWAIGGVDLPCLQECIFTAGQRGPDGQKWELDFADPHLRSGESLIHYLNLPRDNNKISRLRLGGFLSWNGATSLFNSFRSYPVEELGRLESISLPQVRLKVPEYREDLVALDRALDSPYFSQLKEVRFSVLPDHSDVIGSVRAFSKLVKHHCQRKRLFKPRVTKLDGR
ncbi:hypothetical protein E1B28_005373 [Marasmius oreades]|uniref:F-box domain-containing protein n=1 Tax=Marasmius oreades TaxID=181124 RepID=A0A9P7S3E2_9AGAR|nr:uncharacterized protein E1B28_005373 [Marasmius oreades]KAG7094545.1 hypothetical protein E1B28_005373 [Marasmius oreades]